MHIIPVAVRHKEGKAVAQKVQLRPRHWSKHAAEDIFEKGLEKMRAKNVDGIRLEQEKLHQHQTIIQLQQIKQRSNLQKYRMLL